MLDITEILSEEGRSDTFEVLPNLNELSYRFGSFPVADSSTATFKIIHEEGDKLFVEGEAELKVIIPCARCLAPVKCDLMIRPELEIDLNDNEYIDGCYLDVDQLIHDEALLVWPERTLCRSDCKGLCIKCGKNLNEGPCSCDTDSLDPRMAKVLDIFKNAQE